MRRIAGFLRSLAGRIFIIMTIGMTLASILSLAIAEQVRQRYIERVRLERVVASTADIAERLRMDPDGTDRILQEARIIGAHPAAAFPSPNRNLALGALLRARLGPGSRAEGSAAPPALCTAQYRILLMPRAAGLKSLPDPDCWVVGFRDARGQPRLLSIDLPHLPASPSSTLNPIFLLLILTASAILSLLVARFATAPLRRLSSAARAFSLSIDPEPIPEAGPSEVRTALATFNLMQHRIRDGFRERTHILAAIAHDLQTPLTRLRLRLEQVEDETLRERLIADLAATQALVRDGLELARSSESREDWSIVDLDSLLSSIAEDAAEFGGAVSFVGGCGARVRVKPDSLTRSVTNLVDNALKYAGDAEIGCVRTAEGIEIHVRDHGPGIPDALLAEIFEPFVRGDGSRSRVTGGTGIGLTIVQAQVKTLGGAVSLANHPGGGVLARIRLMNGDAAPPNGRNGGRAR